MRKQNLHKYDTFLQDDSLNPKYFYVKNLSSIDEKSLSYGKFLFFIGLIDSPSNPYSIKTGTDIKLEFLHEDGTVINHRIVSPEDTQNKTVANGANVSVEIVKDLDGKIQKDSIIAPGQKVSDTYVYLTILAELEGKNLPQKWKNTYNYKLRIKYNLRKNFNNDGEVYFFEKPELDVREVLLDDLNQESKYERSYSHVLLDKLNTVGGKLSSVKLEYNISESFNTYPYVFGRDEQVKFLDKFEITSSEVLRDRLTTTDFKIANITNTSGWGAAGAKKQTNNYQPLGYFNDSVLPNNLYNWELNGAPAVSSSLPANQTMLHNGLHFTASYSKGGGTGLIPPTYANMTNLHKIFRKTSDFENEEYEISYRVSGSGKIIIKESKNATDLSGSVNRYGSIYPDVDNYQQSGSIRSVYSAEFKDFNIDDNTTWETSIKINRSNTTNLKGYNLRDKIVSGSSYTTDSSLLKQNYVKDKFTLIKGGRYAGIHIYQLKGAAANDWDFSISDISIKPIIKEGESPPFFHYDVQNPPVEKRNTRINFTTTYYNSLNEEATSLYDDNRPIKSEKRRVNLKGSGVTLAASDTLFIPSGSGVESYPCKGCGSGGNEAGEVSFLIGPSKKDAVAALYKEGKLSFVKDNANDSQVNIDTTDTNARLFISGASPSTEIQISREYSSSFALNNVYRGFVNNRAEHTYITPSALHLVGTPTGSSIDPDAPFAGNQLGGLSLIPHTHRLSRATMSFEGNYVKGLMMSAYLFDFDVVGQKYEPYTDRENALGEANNFRGYFLSESGNFGIGTFDPKAKLHVKGDIIAENYIVSSSFTEIQTQTLSGSTNFGDTTDDTHQFTGHITASGNISASGNLIVGGTITGTVTDSTNSVHTFITDNESTNEENQITFVEDAQGGGANRGLEADGDLTYNPSLGRLSTTNINASTNISSSGDIYVKDDLFVGDDIKFNSSPAFVGNVNSSYSAFQYFSEKIIQISATGFGAFTYRVDGHSEAGLLFVTSSGQVGIGGWGGSGPQLPTEPLSVIGNISASGDLETDGYISAGGNITSSGHISSSGNFIGHFPDTNDNALHYPIVSTGQRGTLESQNSLKINPSTDEITVGSLKTTTHITSSGNISASGNLHGTTLILSGGNFQWSSASFAALGSGVGGGTPGGSNTQVQFNNGGSFGGDAGLVYNSSTNALTIDGNISSSGELLGITNITASGRIYAQDLYIDKGAGTSIYFDADGTSKHGISAVPGHLTFTSGSHEIARFSGKKLAIGTTTATSNLTVVGDLRTTTHITASGNITASGDDNSFGKVVNVVGEDSRLKIKSTTGDKPGLEWHDGANRKWITYSDGDGGGHELKWKNASNTDVMELDQNGQLYVTQKIVHLGDPDTFIDFTGDDINIQAGGANMLDFTQNDGGQDEITFNEEGHTSDGDIDIRMESRGDTKAFFIDAATNAIQFGSNANTHITASGNISSSGTTFTNHLTVRGDSSFGGTTLIGNQSTDLTGITGRLQVAGHITASGVITSSVGAVFGDLNTGTYVSASSDGRLEISGSGAASLDVQGALTASSAFINGIVSSSGNMIAPTFVGNIDAVDGDFDGTLEADAITVDGVALNTVIAGVTVTNATNATNAEHVKITDNESTAEENQIVFVEDAQGGTSNRGLEADGDLTYNPSQTRITTKNVTVNDKLLVSKITPTGSASSTLEFTNNGESNPTIFKVNNDDDQEAFVQFRGQDDGRFIGLKFINTQESREAFLAYREGDLFFSSSTDLGGAGGGINKVGIGGPFDSNPDHMLHLRGPSGVSPEVSVQSEFNNTALNFTRYGVNKMGWDDSDSFSFGVYSSNTDTSLTTRMSIIGNTGNVGINRTSPREKLHVGGSISASNMMFAQGGISSSGNVFAQGSISASGAILGTDYYVNGNQFTDVTTVAGHFAIGNSGQGSLNLKNITGSGHFFTQGQISSSGNMIAPTFVGNIDAVDGDFDGTLEADAITVDGVALNTVIAGVTVTNATNASHVSVADNESENENNLIPFIENASATGNVGLESDGDLHYNPSTGKLTAPVFTSRFQIVSEMFVRHTAANRRYVKSGHSGMGGTQLTNASGVGMTSDPDGVSVTYKAAAQHKNYIAPRACKLVRSYVTIHNYNNDDDIKLNIYKGTAVSNSSSGITLTKIGSEIAPTMDEDKTYFVSTDYSSGNTLSANDFLIVTSHVTSYTSAIYAHISVNFELEYT